MSDKLEKTKKIAKTIGKGTALILKALGEGIAAGCEASLKLEHPEIELNLPTEVTLGVDELKQLKSMYPTQLEKIFKNKKVKLADSPEVYKILSGFYPSQLEAIFGKEND